MERHGAARRTHTSVAGRLRNLSTLLLLTALNCAHGAASPQPASATARASPQLRVLFDGAAWERAAEDQQRFAMAIRALTSVLPASMQAELWALGSPAAAGKADKQDAATMSNFATLGEAVEKLLSQWRPGEAAERHVILLLSHEAGADQYDKTGSPGDVQRLLRELLPRLQQTGAAVHTIVPPEADTSLLQQLAVATDGWYSAAENTAAAERALLALLESLNQRDSVPLHDGLFKIDASVDASQIVVFGDDPQRSVRLIPPASTAISAANTPPNVTWSHHERFDVINVSKPAAGTWQIESQEDVDSRVFIASTLQLGVAAQPRNVLQDRRVILTGWLQRNGKTITDEKTLSTVVFKTGRYRNNTQERFWFPLDDGERADAKAADGIYTVPLDESLPPGPRNFVFEAEALSFQRRAQQRIDFHEFPVWAELKAGPASGHYVLNVVPRQGMINPDQISMVAHIQQRDREMREVRVPRFTPVSWRLDFDAQAVAPTDMLELNVQTNGPDERAFSVWLPPMALHNAAPTLKGQAQVKKEAHAQASRGHEADPHAPHNEHSDGASAMHEPLADEHATAPAEDRPLPVWVTTTLSVLAINAALVVLGWVGLRRWRLTQQRWRHRIEEQLSHG
jgi:uncharacterized protein (TIGR03503 family)